VGLRFIPVMFDMLIFYPSLVVITDLYIIGIAVNKPETDAPLVVDGD
jgi:hypothetical protein